MDQTSDPTLNVWLTAQKEGGGKRVREQKSEQESRGWQKHGYNVDGDSVPATFTKVNSTVILF